MSVIIKPSATIRQNYNGIASICRETSEPVYLTKNGEGDLVVMDIDAFNKREAALQLREKLVEVREKRDAGVPDIDAEIVAEHMRAAIQETLDV